MNETTQPAVAGPVEPTVRPTSALRAAFEEWYAPRFAGNCAANMPKRENDEYRSAQQQIAWLSYKAAVVAERKRWSVDDGNGDLIDALLLKAKDVIARSEQPKWCGEDYRVPHAEWLALQAEVMHRLRERAREASFLRPNVRAERPGTAGEKP